MTTYTVPSPNDTEYWSNWHRPFNLSILVNRWDKEYTSIPPTFIKRYWDYSEFAYFHPVTNEIIRTVKAY